MVVRPLGQADVGACAAIMARTPLWRRYGIATEADARARLGRWFAEVRAGLARVQVADDGGDVIGFVYYLLRGTFGHSGYVWTLGVAGGHRRRGIGGLLMDAAEAEIFGAGPNVFLLVSADNEGAQRFYERRGYRLVGRLDDYAMPGITEVVYRKTKGPIERQSTSTGG